MASGHPAQLTAKSAGAVCADERVRFESIDILSVNEVGDQLIVEAAADGTRPNTGEPFHMQYVWFITHHDGRVSNIRDYMNPLLSSRV